MEGIDVRGYIDVARTSIMVRGRVETSSFRQDAQSLKIP